ncbi:MAG: hypothetical protein E4H38_06910 [Gemmatimonadales bacterium]|nr:MAG: hypothetical protein E4H38_06910 [Gemmatimonadales bacterium]
MNRTLQLAALCLLTLACQEKISAPVECPDLCPGRFEVIDTSIALVVDGDSSFSGYAKAGQGSSLRVSWQFPVSEDRAVVKFVARPDSFTIGDTAYAYVLDSVSLAVTLQYRDTTVKNLVLYLYRLPATLDSTYTFTDAEAAFTPANIIDSILVDDSVVTGRFQRFYSGTDLAKVAIPPADSGVLAFGVQMRASQGTGIRIGSQGAGSDAPGFTSYVTVPTTDTTLARTIPRIVRYASYVSQAVPSLDPAVLTIGGAPSARTLIRFTWPDYLRDSAQILRATLELVPVNPVPGLTGDTAFATVMPVLADLGSKSPPVSDPTFASFGKVSAGQTDTVHVEIQLMTRLWQGTRPLPPIVWVQLVPETSSFSRPEFGSTRTPGFVPRLRVTFARTFPFEGL